MSSTRNKRKRPENDAAAAGAMAPPSSRRRSRATASTTSSQRAAATPAPAASTTANKNSNNTENNTTNTNNATTEGGAAPNASKNEAKKHNNKSNKNTTTTSSAAVAAAPTSRPSNSQVDQSQQDSTGAAETGESSDGKATAQKKSPQIASCGSADNLDKKLREQDLFVRVSSVAQQNSSAKKKSNGSSKSIDDDKSQKSRATTGDYVSEDQATASSSSSSSAAAAAAVANVKQPLHLGRGENIDNNGESKSSKKTKKNADTTTVSVAEKSNVSSSDNSTGSSPQLVEDERTLRIRELMDYRTLLLKRIRICRNAAEKSLHDKPSYVMSGISNNHSLSTTSAPSSETPTIMADDEEIAAFKDMTKLAAQAAKKSRSSSVSSVSAAAAAAAAVSDGGDGSTFGAMAEGKRTSLSLRRGSSVGKRMNAALSSLAPGSNASVTTTASRGNSQSGSDNHLQSTIHPHSQNSASLSKSGKNASKLQGANKSTYAPSVTSSGQPLAGGANKTMMTNHQPVNAAVTPIRPGGGSGHAAKIAKTSQHAHHPSSKQGSLSGVEGTTVNKRSSVSSKSNNKSLGNATNSRAGSVGNNHALPLHHHLVMAGASGVINTTTGTSNTSSAGSAFLGGLTEKVYFPEAVKLREKRDNLQARINAILHTKQRKQPQQNFRVVGGGGMIAAQPTPSTSKQQTKKGGPRNSAFSSFQSQKQQPQQQQHEHHNAVPPLLQPPLPLPKRKKTHWDVVLQEMSWLASDFIEERKWKQSTGRIISSSIPPPRMATAAAFSSLTRNATKSSAFNSRIDATHPAGNSADVANKYDATAIPSSDVNECKMEEDEVPEEKKLPQAATGQDAGICVHRRRSRTYSELSLEDSKVARRVATIASLMISELATAHRESHGIVATDGDMSVEGAAIVKTGTGTGMAERQQPNFADDDRSGRNIFYTSALNRFLQKRAALVGTAADSLAGSNSKDEKDNSGVLSTGQATTPEKKETTADISNSSQRTPAQPNEKNMETIKPTRNGENLDDVEHNACSEKTTVSPTDESPFVLINNHIDKMHKRVAEKQPQSKSMMGEMTEALRSRQELGLTKRQEEVIEVVQRLWRYDCSLSSSSSARATTTTTMSTAGLPSRNLSAGAVLVGADTSGKTMSTCVLLWKHRMNGPQFLFCSRTSVLRWKHELGRFTDIRVLLCGLAGGICSPIQTDKYIADLVAGDVLICEFSMLQGLVNRLKKQKRQGHVFEDGGKVPFCSVVIDSRHASSVLESMNQCSASASMSGKEKEGTTTKQGQGLPPEWGGPPELISSAFWDSVFELLSLAEDSPHGSFTRRLLLEYPNAANDESERSSAISNLAERQQLEILAFRTAFIVGPEPFRFGNFQLARNVISWARVKGKKSFSDKLLRVKRVLYETTKPFCLRFPETLVSTEDFKWVVRRCAMTALQRSEYDSCCAQVRGALSAGLSAVSRNTGDNETAVPSLEDIIRALYRLRRQCFHPRASELAFSIVSTRRERRCIKQPTLRSDCRSKFERTLLRGTAESASQPDASWAMELTMESCKLRELVSILKFEYSFRIHGWDYLKNLVSSERGAHGQCRLGPSDRTKLAIVAALPEVQLVISAFLSALGVQNHLFQSIPNEACASIGEETGTDDGEYFAAVSWAEHQSRLFGSVKDVTTPSCFRNAGDAAKRGSKSVVIASPTYFAAWSGGLGLEAVDGIISVDEDWSGRGGLVMASLVGRRLAGGLVVGDSCQYIKLRCAGSIEENVFGSLPEKLHVFSPPLWPVDHFGNLTLPDSEADALPIYKKVATQPETVTNANLFPAGRLLGLQGQTLRKVLLSALPIPPLFGSGREVLFLPAASPDGHTKIPQHGGDDGLKRSELLFGRELLGSEQSHAMHIHVPWADPDNSGSLKILHPPRNYNASPLPQALGVPSHVLMIHLYFEKVCRCSVLAGAPTASPTLGPLTASADPLSTTPSVAVGASGEGVGHRTELAEAWHKSGLSGKPSDVAASLLFYGWRGDSIDIDTHSQPPASASVNVPAGIVKPSPDRHHDSLKERHNAYAKLYSMWWSAETVRDGSQGFEPAVFFPPLLPGLRSEQTGRSFHGAGPSVVPDRWTVDPADPLLVEPPDTKRKEREAENIPSAKRPKVHTLQDAAPGRTANVEKSAAHNKIGTYSQAGGTSKASPAESKVDATKMKSKDFLDEVSAGPVSFYEDYGLFGDGLIPYSSASAATTTRDVVEPRRTRHNSTDDFSHLMPCDAEEVRNGSTNGGNADYLKSMLLIVKRGPRALPGHPDPQFNLYNSSPMFQSSVDPWLQKKMVPAHSGHLAAKETNGEESTKKSKKKVLSQVNLALQQHPFNRVQPPQDVNNVPGVPQLGPANPGQVRIGKDHRHRLLQAFISRQYGTGLTMFESIPYQLASKRVLKRIEGRVASTLWDTHHNVDGKNAQSDTGTGVGGGVQPSWSMLVKPLKANSNTGDAARTASTSQRMSLRRSLCYPSRVDFGPFEAGYLVAPPGMTGISPPRSRLGVSLPMGVKVPQTLKEQPQPVWTADDDRRLQDFAVRFGMNWMLVARSLSGFDTRASLEKGDVWFDGPTRLRPRSARQCRERWQALARNQPSLASEVRKSERLFRESALRRLDQTDHFNSVPLREEAPSHLLIVDNSLFSNDLILPDDPEELPTEPPFPMDVDKEMDVDKDMLGVLDDIAGVDDKLDEEVTGPLLHGNIELPGQQSTPRKFTALSSSKSKRQFIPITIPGVPGGAQPNQPVPSHPSHMQSVQNSVAAKWASGRTEMWPLQILDCADKNRDSRGGSLAGKEGASSSSSSSKTESTGLNRRQHARNAGGSVSHGHRSSSSSSSRSTPPPTRDQQQRSAAFPPVPVSAASRSTSHHRQGGQSTSPRRASATGPAPPPTNQPYSKQAPATPKGGNANAASSK